MTHEKNLRLLSENKPSWNALARSLRTRFYVLVFTLSCVCLGCHSQPQTTQKTEESSSPDHSPSNVADHNEGNLDQPDRRSGEVYKLIHWNVESGGADPNYVVKQLIQLHRYDIYALSEVENFDAFEEAIKKEWPDRFDVIRGKSGTHDDREDDHLMVIYDYRKLYLVDKIEMIEAKGFRLNDGEHRSPLLCHFRDRETNGEFILIHNHLARGDAELRQEQAKGLREWARGKHISLFAVGDFNFDYEFATQQGNTAFQEFTRDNLWHWIRPETMIDTNWSDRDQDGFDDYPDSMLDFCFCAGAAKNWDLRCRVIELDEAFPDDDRTSDHRPVEMIMLK